MTSLIEQLTQAVFEAPSDLERRRVLADALMEAGDPYGEFIALQFDASARARKRAQKLLERYESAFLQSLAPMVAPLHAKWNLGFVDECVVSVLDPPVPAAFATVQTLWARVGALAPNVLADGALRALRSVRLIAGRTPAATLEELQAELQNSVGRRVQVMLARWPEWAGPQPFV